MLPRTSAHRLLWVVFTLIAILHMPLALPTAHAQSITLTDPNCTRDGLNNAVQSAPDGSTITFNCANPTITFTTEIVIDKTITLDGSGGIILDGNRATRIMNVNSTGNVTLNNLTLQNSVFDVINFGMGGAVINNGTLTINNITFSDNVTQFGGAINNSITGTLTVNGSTFSNNRGVTSGGAIENSGTLNVSSTTFSGNLSFAAGGIYNSGTATITTSTFTGNSADDFGGGIVNDEVLRVTNSIFFGNVANNNGGAIHNNASDAQLEVTNAKFTGNEAPIGDAIRIFAGGGTITNNCFAGNGQAINDNSDTLTDLNQNYWGTSDGPSGVGLGNGDAIIGVTDPSKYSNFLTNPTFTDFTCPTIVPDLYDTPADQQLIVEKEEGVLANDLAVETNSATLETAPDFGVLNLSQDGSFTYTPNTPTEQLDGFRYRAVDLDGASFIGLVCITRSNLAVVVPPQQTTTLGTPIVVTPPIEVRVGNDPNSPQVVRVELNASLGTLSVPVPNQGVIGIPPSEECRQLLDELRTASVPDVPSVVQSDTHGIELMNRNLGSSPRFVPYYQQQGNVAVQGNNTGRLVLEGSVADVNAVLTDLTYTPTAVGVDQLRIVANDGGGGVAVGQVTIIINGPNGGGGMVGGGGSGGGGAPSLTGTGGGNDAAPGVAPVIPIPLGPLTLFEMNQLPNSVVRGEATGATVANGDVFVQVVATNGTLVVGTEQIGDPFLTSQPIFNGAEIFGLTFGGVPVQGFDGDVTVCLRGFGIFYYRDATAMPRTTVQLVTFRDGEFTCATIPNSGTIVLVSTGEAPPEEPAAPNTVSTAQRRNLPDGCMVTTDAIINLREGPGTTNGIIRRIPFDVTLTAFEQEGNWYYVDYWGQRGWMSADFVTPNGRC